MNLYEHTMTSLNGKPFDLGQLEGDVVMIVNVASKCGLTPQYSALEHLHETYGPKGFHVVGFPCNQFMGQEPGSPEEIAEFCSATYGVTFPMSAKIDVNGEQRDPLYRDLVKFADEEGYVGDIRWNFEKFVIGRNGDIVARFAPQVEPDAPEVIALITAQLD